jgi:hypothetical protein
MPKIRTKAKIRFIDFLRPDFFPYPYTLEQAFHVFQWMVATGEKYTKYSHSGVLDLLSMNPSCIGINPVRPIVSIDDLRRRFHYALLASHEVPLVAAWKQANGISIQAEKWILFPHYTPFEGSPYGSEATIKTALEKHLGDSRGISLNVSLNSCHLTARWVGGVSIAVSQRGFKFVLDYGFENDTGWNHTLATSEPNEPFTTTMHRAIANLSEMST